MTSHRRHTFHANPERSAPTGPRPLLSAAVLLLGLAALGPAQAQVFPGSNFGPIPDGARAGPLAYGDPRDIRFNVNGLGGSVTQARVFFRANHPWVGDLKVQLIAPDGRSHLLFERTGATTPTSAGFSANLVSSVQYIFGDDFSSVTGTNWWTAADVGNNDIGQANLFTTVVSGGDGVSNPAPSTSTNAIFATSDPNGTWILRFEDGWAGDHGEVTAAELILIAPGIARTVTNASDTQANSLREMMNLAQPGDAIRFSSFFDTPRTINLASALPLLPDGVGIFGPGADKLTVQRASTNAFRIFNLPFPAHRATLSGMTIANGRQPGVQGGGVFNAGRLTVVETVLRDNVSEAGGGIASSAANLTLLRCTLVGNSAEFGSGVFIRNSNALIDNSTISENSGSRGRVMVFGEGIGSGNGKSNLILRNSTLTDVGGAAGKAIWFEATGASGATTARISNSLFATRDLTFTTVAGNGAAPAVILSEGFNLATDNADGRLTQPSDRLNADAALEPLADYGRGLPVHRPLSTSEAIDNGRATGPRLSDQSGFDRVTDLPDTAYPNAPGGDGSDIGASELPTVPVDVIFANGME